MASLARHNFSRDVESAFNLQINAELTASHTYASMAAYFARDGVALHGIASFFKKSSDEEREHAFKLMNYLNSRGGVVKLEATPAPETEWNSARNAIESALKMEKDVYQSLLNVVSTSDASNDPSSSDFIESEFLEEQVKSIKEFSDMLTSLLRAGADGLGLYIFDKDLASRS